MVIHPPWY
jgi:hypothetical protein